jgi:hypothetical protein
MSKTRRKWFLASVLPVAAWAVAFTAVPASAQSEKLNPPVISCNGATDKTITIKVCGDAVTGAPAGFSLQWVPSGSGFTEENTCSMSASGVPELSTFNLDPGECVDVVVAQPTGAVGESFQCTGDLACSADYDFRAFAHNVPQGPNKSDFTTILLCSTASCPEGGEGCSPGFWKNRAVTLGLYDTSRTLGSVFSFGPDFTSLASKTFLEALNFKGGNTIQAAAQILLRQAVAALLNAENPSVSYPRTVTEVVDAVNGVLNTATPSRDSILALAASLDADNNLQCPLGDGNSDSASTRRGGSAKAAKKAAKAKK